MTRIEDLLLPFKESNSLLNVTNEQIKDYLEEQFQAEITQLEIQKFPEGIVNDVFKVIYWQKDSEHACVLKLCSDRFDRRKNEREIRILKLMQQIKIPAPKVLFHDFNKDRWNRDVICLDFVAGIPLSDLIKTHDQNCFAIIDELKTIIKKLHDHTKSSYFGVSLDEQDRKQERHKSYFSFISRIFFDRIERLKKRGLEIEEFKDFFNKREDVFNTCSSIHVLCHRDITPFNILIHPESYKISAILDWEFAWFSHPALDIASAYYRISNYWEELAEYFKEDFESTPLLNLYVIRRGLLTCSTYFSKQEDTRTLEKEFERLHMMLGDFEK